MLRRLLHHNAWMTHVLTHGMHHRAQVFNMFRQLGVTVDLDGDVIEWEIATS